MTSTTPSPSAAPSGTRAGRVQRHGPSPSPTPPSASTTQRSNGSTSPAGDACRETDTYVAMHAAILEPRPPSAPPPATPAPSRAGRRPRRPGRALPHGRLPRPRPAADGRRLELSPVAASRSPRPPLVRSADAHRAERRRRDRREDGRAGPAGGGRRVQRALVPERRGRRPGGGDGGGRAGDLVDRARAPRCCRPTRPTPCCRPTGRASAAFAMGGPGFTLGIGPSHAPVIEGMYGHVVRHARAAHRGVHRDRRRAAARRDGRRRRATS